MRCSRESKWRDFWSDIISTWFGCLFVRYDFFFLFNVWTLDLKSFFVVNFSSNGKLLWFMFKWSALFWWKSFSSLQKNVYDLLSEDIYFKTWEKSITLKNHLTPCMQCLDILKFVCMQSYWFNVCTTNYPFFHYESFIRKHKRHPFFSLWIHSFTKISQGAFTYHHTKISISRKSHPTKII